jgi:transposase InsO family protein
MLTDNQATIIMTENSDPYKNAIAQRVNGILKQEFSIGDGFRNHLIALSEIEKSFYIYNHKRLNCSCEILIPADAHLNGRHIRLYKKNKK